MLITKIEGSFSSASGKSKIFYTKWAAQEAVKSVLVIAHGMTEYIDRYDPFAAAMTRAGYAVYGADHLGHGRSAAGAGNLGYMAQKDGWKCLVEDVRNLIGIAKRENPGIPILLLGHSMGSFIARVFCDRYSAEIDGAVFMGTCGPNRMVEPGLFLINLLALICGERHRSGFISKVIFGKYNVGIPDAQTPFDWLTTDRAEVQKYVDNSWCGYRFTLSGYRDLMKLIRQISGKNWGEGIRHDLPILLISGDQDPVGSYGEGVRATLAQLKQSGVQEVSMILYEGMRHEVLNENGREKVYEDLVSWCDEVVQGTARGTEK